MTSTCNPLPSAFDTHHPPSTTIIDKCVHCGFCLPTCPTYVLWNEEMDSPRGRIVLMGAGLQEGSELSDTMVGHFDNCLGCMACVTACPSGVRYDLLIEDTRAQVERLHPRTRRERLLRRALFATFPHPARLRATVPLLVVARRLGLTGAAQRSRLLAGQEEDSLPLAKATIAAFEQDDHVVVNAAGCGSAIKDYGHLLRDDPEWSARAEALAAKARDVHELLASVAPRARRGPVELR